MDKLFFLNFCFVFSEFFILKLQRCFCRKFYANRIFQTLNLDYLRSGSRFWFWIFWSCVVSAHRSVFIYVVSDLQFHPICGEPQIGHPICILRKYDVWLANRTSDLRTTSDLHLVSKSDVRFAYYQIFDRNVENRFKNLKNQFKNLKNQFKNLESGFKNLENQFKNLESGFKNLNNGFKNVKNQFKNFKNRFKKTSSI